MKRRQGAGFSIRSFADHLDLPYGQVRKAVKNGEITMISFGGVSRIPPSEVERVQKMFGLKPKEENSGINHEDNEQERND